MKSGTNLEKVLTEGHFAVTGELGPPKGTSADFVRRKADIIKNYVDAVNITDNQTAVVRMSSVAACAIIKEAGLDPVMQMTCRDRNRIAMQSEILGAVALGIGNLLCLSGDHQKFGNHPESKNVHDVDSMQLIQIAKRMRDDAQFLSGDKVSGGVSLFIGAAANPFADPFEFRPMRLEKKMRAGADFIQTQGVFDVERFARYMEMVRERGLHEQTHILAGVIPMKSAGMARYMRDYVAGLTVPNELVERMEDAEDAKEEGVRITLEIIEQLREIEGVHGIHLMAVAWEDIVPVIVEQAGLHPRPIV
ncbi:MAG: methylenetetrahydrofolate reductase [Chloroflexi bacterium]|jgi:methylenetetrahydrofolate reductase (NADPH)|nr:methylenetetrahydrofolate reductase [Chloroflexota bacterium]